jgi:hypothetical protein
MLKYKITGSDGRVHGNSDNARIFSDDKPVSKQALAQA